MIYALLLVLVFWSAAAQAQHSPGSIVTIKKAVAETVTSSTTLQNDDDFLFRAAANTSYEVIIHAVMEGATAGDFKWAWTVPSGTTGWHGGTRTNTAGTAINQVISETLTTTLTAGTLGTGAGNRTMARIVGYFVVGSTAGTIQFQWAQNASNGTGTSVRASSRMTYRIAR